MNRQHILSLLAAVSLAAAGCNTTKTDARGEAETADGATSSATDAPTASGVLAPPSVGTLTSVSPASDATAADFAWTDGRGEHKLSDYRGKVVFINFWGTWCPPCRRELPSLVKIREELAPASFEIIGINVSERPRSGTTVEQHVAEFASSNNIRYPLVIGDGNLVDAYGGVNVVPTTIVVGRDGAIVERIEGTRDEAGFRALIAKAESAN